MALYAVREASHHPQAPFRARVCNHLLRFHARGLHCRTDCGNLRWREVVQDVLVLTCQG